MIITNYVIEKSQRQKKRKNSLLIYLMGSGFNYFKNLWIISCMNMSMLLDRLCWKIYGMLRYAMILSIMKYV